MEADLGAGLDVGEFGLVVQKQDQAGALKQVSLGGSLPRQEASLDDELGGEIGLVKRGWTRQGVRLWVTDCAGLTVRTSA